MLGTVVADAVFLGLNPSYTSTFRERKQYFLNSLADSSIAKTLELYAARVKAICISFLELQFPAGTVLTVFTRFVHLHDIAVWDWRVGGGRSFHINLAIAWNSIGLRLAFRSRRISCANLEIVFAVADSLAQPDFANPYFSRVIHLDILDNFE